MILVICVTMCFICFSFRPLSSIEAQEGVRGETTPALWTKYLKSPIIFSRILSGKENFYFFK